MVSESSLANKRNQLFLHAKPKLSSKQTQQQSHERQSMSYSHNQAKHNHFHKANLLCSSPRIAFFSFDVLRHVEITLRKAGETDQSTILNFDTKQE